MESKLRLHVNGVEQEIAVPPHHTLLEVLRDYLGLHSVREGCGIGMCGACTVLVDGRPISACLTLAAMVEDHDVLTVEGLGVADGHDGPVELDPLQKSFIEHTGFQCSYCTPGIILSAKALISERPNATDDEIREYLSGNLCRCGSYVKILDSVRDAISRLR